MRLGKSNAQALPFTQRLSNGGGGILLLSATNDEQTGFEIDLPSIMSGTNVPKFMMALRLSIDNFDDSEDFYIWSHASLPANYRFFWDASGDNWEVSFSGGGNVRSYDIPGGLSVLPTDGTPFILMFAYDDAQTQDMEIIVATESATTVIEDRPPDGGFDTDASANLVIGQRGAQGSDGDMTVYEVGFAEDWTGTRQDLATALVNDVFGNVTDIDWSARYELDDNANGNVTNGDLSLEDREGGVDITVGDGTPVYAGALLPSVPLFGKDTGFNALTSKYAGNIEKFREFWNGENNVLVLADSFGISNRDDRMQNGLFTTMNLAKGWMGYGASCSGSSGQGGPVKYIQIGSITYPADGGRTDGIDADESLYDGNVVQGIPVKITEFEVGTGYSATANRAMRIDFAHDNDDSGAYTTLSENALNDSFIAGDLRIGFYTYKAAGQQHVTGFGWNDTTVNNNTDFDVSGDGDGFSYHGDRELASGDGRGWIYADDSWAADVGGNNVFFQCAGVRIFDPNKEGSEMLPALAQNSWSVIGHSNPKDLDNVLGEKRYTQAELNSYLGAVIQDTSKPLWVVLFINQESGISEQRTQFENIKNKMKAACTANSLTFGGFLLISPWRTGQTLASATFPEACLTYAARDPDSESFAISLYALTDGLLLDNSDDTVAQAAFASANGYDAIETLGAGTIDISSKDLLDGANLHPADAESATAFGFILNKYIKQLT